MDNQKPDIQSERLHKLPIPVSVRICGQSVTLDQFLDWVPGKILTFEQPVSSPLEMCIGTQTIGEGQAVKVGAKIGLRLNRICNSPSAEATTIETR